MLRSRLALHSLRCPRGPCGSSLSARQLSTLRSRSCRQPRRLRIANDGPMPHRNVQMRYSAPAVAQASAFTSWVLRRRDSLGLPGSPDGGALASFRILLRAPRLWVELTDSPSGELIRAYLIARRRGIRSHLYAQGVLTLPPGDVPLLRGRRFQAARTNVTRARHEGIVCRSLPEPDRPRVLSELNESTSLLDRKVDRWWVAEGSDGHAVGLALVIVDVQWAMLKILAAERYEARYLLHTHVVGELRASGVRYLFAECQNALALPAGLQYLQARLGYEIANLRTPSRRRVESRPVSRQEPYTSVYLAPSRRALTPSIQTREVLRSQQAPSK
jgi:hypothetical protein